jgi:hypothetical protein
VADLEGSETREIDAPIERVFAIAADIDRAPEWQGVMKSVDVVERDADGRAALGDGRTRATYSLEIGLNRALSLLRRTIRGPAEARIRSLLVERPVEGLKERAEKGG